jgi:hypothetical protein
MCTHYMYIPLTHVYECIYIYIYIYIHIYVILFMTWNCDTNSHVCIRYEELKCWLSNPRLSG